MEGDENLDFLLNYQSVFLEDSKGYLTKSADIQRRCLGQIYPYASKDIDNASVCIMLEKKLKKLSQTVDTGNTNIYQNSMQEKMAQLGIGKPTDLKSDLSSVNIASMIKPLPCSTSEKVLCQNSENFSLGEYQDFITVLKDMKGSNSYIPKTSKASSSLVQSSHSENSSARTFHSESNIQSRKPEETSSKSSFKTAAEELQIQNMKKFGNTHVQGGLKRKLGTRRNLNSKFVSPLLSSNGSEEIATKSEEWPVEDERLKNIEPKMVELIKSEIMDCGAPIHWNDIAGLEFAKTAIQEAVVWPLLRPDIFTGLRRPPKGILLFGPPGTGKTLIGKCVASQSKSTFFSISASSLTSKWVGDGEKMVRALFAVARCHQPAVIFIDEIDSLLSQRSDTEHESSRRIKTEFLVQLDGATTDNEERLLVIGATNRPQELDEAARRRFVKRLYIPLPEFEARLHLVKKLISSEKHCLTDGDFIEVANLSDGYSGADIRTLCAEASLGPIRSLDFNAIENIQVTQVRPLQMEDFQKALTRVKSSVSPKDLEQYVVWDGTYGSGSSR